MEELLKERELLEKVEDHKVAVGKCYRCKTVVEPYLSPQRFVNIKPLAEPAIQAVEDGRIRIIPEGWTNNYLGWMRDIKDWCISRQIVYGHQIPVWYDILDPKNKHGKLHFKNNDLFWDDIQESASHSKPQQI